MNLKQALERIEALERRVKELEARPEHVHHHYPLDPTRFQPLPPQWPQPPLTPQPGTVWCTDGLGGVSLIAIGNGNTC